MVARPKHKVHYQLLLITAYLWGEFTVSFLSGALWGLIRVIMSFAPDTDRRLEVIKATRQIANVFFFCAFCCNKIGKLI